MKTGLAILVLLVALALAAGCAQQGTSPATPAATATPAPVSSPPPAPTTAAPPATTPPLPTSTTAITTIATPVPTATYQTKNTTVHISNSRFVPDTLTVLPGTGIFWVNDDNVTHTVTATGLFNSGEIGHGLEFSYTFGSVGTYKYTLLENPSVNGTIIVMGPPGNWGDVGN